MIDLKYFSIQEYVSAVLEMNKMLGHGDETRETLGLHWILGGGALGERKVMSLYRQPVCFRNIY